jgi:hypothetical protein
MPDIIKKYLWCVKQRCILHTQDGITVKYVLRIIKLKGTI